MRLIGLPISTGTEQAAAPALELWLTVRLDPQAMGRFERQFQAG
jgi:hypothetical protein